MKFSALLQEAILSVDSDLDKQQAAALQAQIVEFLEAWIAIHEPDDDDQGQVNPQRALVLMLMEELADRVEIPIVS